MNLDDLIMKHENFMKKICDIVFMIIDWILVSIFFAGILTLILMAYYGIKEEIRHREAVAELRLEYAEAINNLTVR